MMVLPVSVDLAENDYRATPEVMHPAGARAHYIRPPDRPTQTVPEGWGEF